MMSDIFSEVQEEIRQEQMRKLWRRLAPFFTVMAAIIVLGVGGWQIWRDQSLKKANASGLQFQQALALIKDGKISDASLLFKELEQKGSGGYALLAKFRDAAALSQDAEADPQKRAAAAEAYLKLARDVTVDMPLQHLALVRASLLQLDTVAYPELESRLRPLTAQDASMRHSAREILALSAWKHGDLSAAGDWLRLVATDAEVPHNLRARADVLLAQIAAEQAASKKE